MTRVNDIYAYLCGIAPLGLQMDFDNSGLQLGHCDAEVRRVLLALDVTGDVAEEAIASGAELIVSHHPLIFTPLKRISDDSAEGAVLLRLLENRIAVISMHTNLDIAEGGVNDVLMEALGARTEGALDKDGCGRVGELPAEMSMGEFLSLCKRVLHTGALRYYDSGRAVRRLAVMGGAGGDAVWVAYEAGCDAYLTADIKYHQFLEAKELGMNLIDGDHFGTEDPVIPHLAKKLASAFPAVEFAVSKVHAQVVSFF